MDGSIPSLIWYTGGAAKTVIQEDYASGSTFSSGLKKAGRYLRDVVGQKSRQKSPHHPFIQQKYSVKFPLPTPRHYLSFHIAKKEEKNVGT